MAAGRVPVTPPVDVAVEPYAVTRILGGEQCEKGILLGAAGRLDRAIDRRSRSRLHSLVDEDAAIWLSDKGIRGADDVVTALLADGAAELVDIGWTLGTGRWEALCSARYAATDVDLHVTLLLKVIKGNWQLVYLHLG